jgi:hypothetical protein
MPSKLKVTVYALHCKEHGVGAALFVPESPLSIAQQNELQKRVKHEGDKVRIRTVETPDNIKYQAFWLTFKRGVHLSRPELSRLIGRLLNDYKLDASWHDIHNLTVQVILGIKLVEFLEELNE